MRRETVLWQSQKRRNYFQPLCFETTLVTSAQLFQKVGKNQLRGLDRWFCQIYSPKLKSECHIISFQKVYFLGKHRTRT